MMKPAILVAALWPTAAVVKAEPSHAQRTAGQVDPVVAYAPLVHLHREERAWPISADSFLRHSWLGWAHAGCRTDYVFALDDHKRVGRRLARGQAGKVDARRLGSGGYAHGQPKRRCRNEGRAYTSAQHTRPHDKNVVGRRGREGFYLDLDDKRRHGEPLLTRSGPQTNFNGVPAYFEEQGPSSRGYRITYWFFYPFSRARGPVVGAFAHEGDWERVSIRLRPGPRPGAYVPVSLRSHAHDGYGKVRWQDVRKTGGTHPVVFSALGSHATYPTPGPHETLFRGVKAPSLFSDQTLECKTCPQWRTWRLLLNAREEPWYGYGGAWGRATQNVHSTGPLGPSSYKLQDLERVPDVIAQDPPGGVRVTPPAGQVLPGGGRAPRAGFDWSMDSRLEGDQVGNVPLAGSADDPSLYSGSIRPTTYAIRLNACSTAPGDAAVVRYLWTVGKQTAASSSCAGFSWRFAKEGTYPVTLVVEDAGGQRSFPLTRDVRVQDWLVVSVGDSVASGEGVPDRPRGSLHGWGPFRARWRESRCHRSGRAGPARAALKLERQDPRTSVSLLHLACSGATLEGGLLGKQPGRPGALPAQLDAAAALTRGTQVDAVLLSAAANDVGFAEIVKKCLLQRSCERPPPFGAFPRLARWLDVQHQLSSRLPPLAGRFARLADRLGRLGVAPSRVYISEYFNPTRDHEGRYCGASGKSRKAGKRDSVGRQRGISGSLLVESEWRWAEQRVLTRLNRAVRHAARTHGWTYVDAIDGLGADRGGGFFRHGYCAAGQELSGRWIVTSTESAARQGGFAGTMHPNWAGHVWYGGRIAEQLQGPLYQPSAPP